MTDHPQRTGQQRKAIEVFCALLAKEMNDQGLDQRQVLAKIKEGVDIPWSQETVKDNLWRQIQIALLSKESTTELDPGEVSRVYEVLDKWTSQTLGIHVPFPDRHGEQFRDVA